MFTISTSSIWRTESSPGRQALFATLGAVVGVALIYGSRHIHGIEPITSTSAFFLGLLILVISVVILVRGGKQVITVDPLKRHIVIEDIARFGSKKRLISFSQISDVNLGELGDKEGGSISYHVVVKLNNGKEIALFVGAFDGTYDRSVVEARCRRLSDNLRSA